jgi:serine/threonine protein kinase
VGLVPLAFPTMAGTCVGTPRYASPEQARGTCVDERSDIYAAGIVLYTLLAGCGPFDQIKGTVPVLRAHVSEEPLPPSHYTPAPFPPELDLVVMKAIAKRAEDRYPDAVSFSRALTLVVGRLCVPLSEMLTAQWASERDAKGSANDAPIEPVDFDAPTMFCCDEELHALRRATPTECEIRTVAAPAPATCEGAKDALGSPRVSVSRVEVLVSAAAFAALASGLAHWFVR